MSYAQSVWAAAHAALLDAVVDTEDDVTITFYDDTDTALTEGGLIDKAGSAIDESGNIIFAVDVQPVALVDDGEIDYVEIASDTEPLIRLPCEVGSIPEPGKVVLNALVTVDGLTVQLASLTVLIPEGGVIPAEE